MIAKIVAEMGRSMKSSGVSTRARLARNFSVHDPAEHHSEHDGDQRQIEPPEDEAEHAEGGGHRAVDQARAQRIDHPPATG